MKIKLANEKEINNVNIYLNGQYQEELVVQIMDADIMEILDAFKSTENLSEIQVFDSDILVAYYSDYSGLKSLRTSDNVITIILSQATTISSLLNGVQNNVVSLNNSINSINNQINPIFDWDNSSLNQCKFFTYKKMSEICTKNIYDGFEILVGGKVRKFALTETDQINLAGLTTLIMEGATSVPYHADGELCRAYSVSDFMSIMQAATRHKTYYTTLCNHVNRWIDSCTTKEDLEKVEFSFEKMPVEFQTSMMSLLSSFNGETGSPGETNTETE